MHELGFELDGSSQEQRERDVFSLFWHVKWDVNDDDEENVVTFKA